MRAHFHSSSFFQSPLGRFRTALALLGAILLLLLWSCQLGSGTKVEDTASFDQLYDSLSKYDSVIIVFNDANGRFLDTVYQGKVDSHAKLVNLPVKGWDGGKAIIRITGITGGKVVYEVEKKFDGTVNQVDVTTYVILPGTALSGNFQDWPMTVGDSLKLPVITVTPDALNDKSIRWSVSDSSILQLGSDLVRAKSPGNANLTARLRTDSTKAFVILVTVNSNTRLPDSLFLSPNPMQLSASGAPGQFTIRSTPATADKSLDWKSDDSTIARVSPDGSVQGLKPGSTRIWATSKIKSGTIASADVQVAAEIPVTQIAFLNKPGNLFVGGVPESLLVQVTPTTANLEVDFSLADSSLASIANGKLTALKAGTAQVIAKSRRYPTITDTLRLTILAGVPVQSVSIANKPASALYTGGPALNLRASALPSQAPQIFAWRSSAPSLASIDDSGKVVALSPGAVIIYALSKVDSTRRDSATLQIKRDMPQLAVGRDTVISVGQSITFTPVAPKQSGGSIVQFKWDLDGDQVWDDSASALKPVSFTYNQAKDYAARFYIKDDQGNDTTVLRQVKAVSGSVVLIQAPLDKSYASKSPIKVTWTVDGKAQDSLTQETLKDGANTVTRAFRDSLNRVFSASITVFFDTVAPNKPLVHGIPLTAGTQPTWTWATGGGGGTGAFRVSVDSETFSGAEIRDTSFTPASALAAGAHTFYVQERDAAGNWSTSGKFTTTIDLTVPASPTVHVAPAGTTNQAKPVWTWSSAGGSGQFQFLLDKNDFSGVIASVPDTTFTPATGLADGSHTLYVRERGKAGTWSTAGSAGVVIDATPPQAPSVSAPPSPTNFRRPTWTWATRGGGSGNWRYKMGDSNLSAGATETFNAYYTPSTDLAAGTYTLHVQERDSVGNWSASDSASVTIDLSAPNQPNIVSPPTPTRSARPTWTWSSNGGGGNGTYQYQLDANPAVTTTSLTFTPGSALADGTHTLKVQEKNNAGTWSLASSSSVLVKSAPLAPTVSVTAALTNAPNWTWTPAANSGGNGTYVYQLDGGPNSSAQPVTQYSPVLGEGSHTLCVYEQDVLGSGAQGCKSLQVDLTPPLVTFTAPLGMAKVFSNSPNATGTATDANDIKSISYILNSGAAQSSAFTGSPWTLNSISWVEDRNILTVTVTDNANNSTTIRDTVYKKSNVIFVRKTATGDGTSWANAYGELNIPLSNSALTGKAIWVSAGTYTPTVAQLTSGSGMEVPTDDSVYGGFASNGTGISLATRDINLNQTIIQDPNGDGGLLVYLSGANIIFNGFILEKANSAISISNGINDKIISSTIRNCTSPYNDPAVIYSDGTSLIDSCVFTGNLNTHRGAVRGSGFVISNTTIQDNTSSSLVGGINVQGDVTMHHMTFSDNLYDDGNGGHASGHVAVTFGTLTYQKSTCTFDGLADGSGISNLGATVIAY